MQYVKVEPSRLLTTNIFVQSLISRFKHTPKGGGGLTDSRNSTQQ